MAEFPTYEEMAKNVAEKALDEFLYDGKSIREWMQIIASEDCISRQKVLDILKDKWNMFSDANDAMQESIDTIEAFPSVIPKPKMGRWKYIQYDKPPIGNWHCSECGRIVFLLNSQKSGETPLYNYCPWCGAKMQEVEK